MYLPSARWPRKAYFSGLRHILINQLLSQLISTLLLLYVERTAAAAVTHFVIGCTLPPRDCVIPIANASLGCYYILLVSDRSSVRTFARCGMGLDWHERVHCFDHRISAIQWCRKWGCSHPRCLGLVFRICVNKLDDHHAYIMSVRDVWSASVCIGLSSCCLTCTSQDQVKLSMENTGPHKQGSKSIFFQSRIHIREPGWVTLWYGDRR